MLSNSNAIPKTHVAYKIGVRSDRIASVIKSEIYLHANFNMYRQKPTLFTL